MLLSWLRRRRSPDGRVALEAEWLEPRVLYSADLAAGLLPAAVTTDSGEARTLSATGEYVTSAATTQAPAVAQAYALTALNFERNDGQEPGTAEFVARGSGYAIGLAGGNAEIALSGASSAVQLELVNANPGLAAQGEDLLQARSSYLVGNDRTQWHTDIPNYAAVRYDDAWNGIDVRYYGTQRQLEYDFIVAAGADAGQVQLRFHGAELSLDSEGNLLLTMADGRELRFAAPVSYQDGPAGREAVRSSYQIHADGSVGFALGDYDHGRTLVIDPVLNYATYFGGSGNDVATDVAVDSDGNVYITGFTTSTGGVLGTILGSILGGTKEDIFVAKFNADLSQLLLVARVGGTGDDNGLSIAVNAAKEVIVTGFTKSADFSLSNASDSSIGGVQDAFLFKLKDDFSDFVFSSYVGDAFDKDAGTAVGLDSAGNIYLAGAAAPATGAGSDAWLAKYTAGGAFVSQLKYGGAGGNEYATDLALDSSDNIYVVGVTDSAGLSMPNGLDTTRPGKKEGFLLRYDSSFTLQYGTYVGGNEDDSVAALAVADNGYAYLVGQTNHSDVSTFRRTAGALRTAGDAKQTAFLTVFDTHQSGASSLVYSTLISGTKKDDGATGVALAGNRVVVLGQSDSDDAPITSDAAQSTNAGKALYIAVIAPQGHGLNDLQYGTYYGSNVMPGFAVVAPATQRLYVAASTSTAGLAKPGAYDTSADGGSEALVLELTLNAAPTLAAGNALPAVVEDQPNPGALVSSLIATQVTDADANALRGIAVTSADNSNGSWQYALDGTTWVAIGSPTPGNALLLPADGTARVRFVPSGNISGSAALGFRAWDRTSGSVGGSASTLSNGGATAFSTGQAASTVSFVAVNDAPVRTGTALVNLHVDEGTTSLGLAGIAYAPGDPDESGQTLTYTVTAVPVGSVGRITLASGATVTAGTSYTLAELQGMQFVGATGVTSGTGPFSFRVRDNGGTANGAVDFLDQSLTITVTNRAPVLGTPIAFPSMLEDGSGGTGTRVMDLIAGLASDAGGVLGIAITDQSSPNASRWEYTRNGGVSWTNMNSGMDESKALLLAADSLTRIRYVPSNNWTGTGTLTIRAWDQSGGTAGSTQADVRINGGSTPFSSASRVATIAVLPVNDQPVRNATSLAPRNVFENSNNGLGLGSLAYDQGGGPDEDTQVLSYTVTDIDGLAGIGTLTLSNGTAVVAGNSYTLAQLQGLRFVVTPGVITGSGSFSFDVRDNGGTANGGDDTLSQSLTINVFNRAPTLNVANPLPTIAEDPTVNDGMRVSALVAGQITDPNGIYGIAVVAAANPNGAWEYSRDDGANWTPFGTVSAANAVLLAADGLNRVRFAPAANWNGTAGGLTFRAWDQSGGTAGATTASIGTLNNTSPYSSTTATASITVTPVDDPTTVVADSNSVPEDSVASGNVLANDSDIDTVLAVASYGVAGDATVYPAGQGAVIAGIGNISLAANGHYSFTPLANWNGTVPLVSYTTNSSVVGTLAITVSSVNDLPVAAAATPSGLEDAAVITVTLTASDVDGSIVGFTLQNLPAHGQLYEDAGLSTAAAAATPYAAGVFYFVPDPDFNGSSTFSYRVTDDLGAISAAATVTITVTSVNDAPLATVVTVSGVEDAASIALNLGGSDVDGTIAGFTLLNLPLNGVLYRDTALTLAASAGTSYASGSFYFVPAPDFNGTSSFDYRVTDNQGGTSAPASATITVASVNDAPVANAVSASGLEDATSIAITLAGNDVDGSIASFTLSGLPANGVLYTDAGLSVAAVAGTAYASGSFYFVPDANFNGTTSFWYRVTDDLGLVSAASAAGNIIVASVNDLPIANPAAASGVEDDASILVALTGSDVEGAIAGFTLLGLPAHGVLYTDASLGNLAVAGTSYGSGNFYFVPAADFNGTASFSYRVADGQGGLSTLAATATISVSAVNDAPVANAVSASALEDTASVVITLAGNDVDGSVVSFTLTSLPVDGLLYTDSALSVLATADTPYVSGTFYFAPPANFNGGTSFSYRVTDDLGVTSVSAATASIMVASVNDLPTAATVSASGVEDAPFIALTLAGNDVDGSIAGFTLQNLPANGVLFTNPGLTSAAVAGATYASGDFFFVPAADFNGSTSFAYQVKDDVGDSSAAAATVTIAISSVNDAPVANPAGATGIEDAPVIAITLSGSDVDGTIVGFTLQGLPGEGVLYTDAALTQLAASGTLYASGDFYFVPATDFNGTSTFSYVVTDDLGAVSTAPATASIAVGATNDPPVALAVSATGLEDATSIAITLAGTDSDDAVDTYTLQNLPTRGVLYTDATLSSAAVAGFAYSTATFHFVPAPNFNGTTSFSYRVTDEFGVMSLAAATATINVTAVNDAPVANAASATGLEDAASITINLGGSDLDGSVSSFTLASLPNGGTLYTNAGLSAAAAAGVAYTSGTFYFVPSLNFNGTANFSYRVTDDLGAPSAAAIASITITSVNDAPTAGAITANGLEDATSIAVTLLASDVDGTISAFTLQNLPANGVLYRDAGLSVAASAGTAYATGSFYFVPAPDFNGSTTFSYRATDNAGSTSGAATATINVTAVNDAPSAHAATASGLEDAPVITVTLAGSDVDGSIASFWLQTLPAKGQLYTDAARTTAAATATGYGSGTFYFVPAADFNGTTGFSYAVMDNLGATSAAATATITVTSVNDAPVAGVVTASGQEDATSIAVTLAGSDADGSIASFTLLNLPVNGLLYRDAALTLAASAGTAYASGNFYFVPAANYNGTSSFDYRVTDDQGATSAASATATITVVAVNDAPVANAVSASGLEDAASIAITLAGNDVDDSVASFTLASLPANGVLYSDPGLTLVAVAGNPYASGTFYFLPAGDFNGTASFSYGVTDTQGLAAVAPATATIIVSPVNDLPVADPVTASGSEDAASILVTLTGSDVDGTVSGFTLLGLPSDGVLYTDPGLTTAAVVGTAYASGSFHFLPAQNFNGAASFSYRVTDDQGATSALAAGASITVAAVNDAPVANAATASGLEDAGPIAITLAGNDVDGSVATFRLASLPAGGTLYRDAGMTLTASAGTAYASGTFYFVPQTNFNGTASFSYTVTDDLGLSSVAAASASIVVAPVNDTPTGTAVTAAGSEDSAFIAITLAGSDVEGAIASYTLTALPANGVLYTDATLVTLAAAGTPYSSANFYFVPAADFAGTTTLAYQVTDAEGATSALAASGTITVTPVNDPPVADSVNVIGAEDDAFIAVVLGGSDVDDAVTGFTLQDLPANGLLYVDAALTTLAVTGIEYASSTFYLVPPADYHGVTGFDYVVSDDQGAASVAAARATITVASVNDAPLANNATATGAEDAASIVITLSGSDRDGTVNSITLQTLPSTGQLYTDAARTVLAAAGTPYSSGTFYFVPAADFNGSVDFAYVVRDDEGATSTAATATVTVTPVNDAPQALAVTASGAEDANSIAITLAGSDIDGAIASYTLQDLPANGLLYTDAGLGSLAVAGASYASGTFWFRPAPDFNGTASFAYRVADTAGASSAAAATATIAVTPVNDAPVAGTVTAAGLEDAAFIAVTLGGTDVDGTVASVTLRDLPSHGLLFTDALLTTVAAVGMGYAPGTFYFVPDAQFNGSTSFTFEVTDDQGADSVVATATLAVTAVNDAPLASAASATGLEDASSIALTLTAADIDGTIASFTLQGLPANGVLYTDAALSSAAVAGTAYGSGTFFFVPARDFNGTSSFSFLATDNLGLASAPATGTITVTAVNDAPVANAAAGNGLEDATSVAVVLGGSDVDGTVTSITLQGLPSNGVLYTDAARTIAASTGTTHAPGAFYLVPASNFNGISTFGYQVTDDLGAVSATATATLTIGAVNDAPVANAAAASGLEDAASIAITLSGGDIDGTIASFTLQALPANGLLYTDVALSTVAVAGTAYGSGNFFFVPARDFNGTSSFSFFATDNPGLASAPVTATITIIAVNDAPVANVASANGLEDAASIAVTLGGSDVDGTVTSVTLQGLPANGLLYTDAARTTAASTGTAYAPGTFYFVPAADFNGVAAFAYQAIDDLGAASAAAGVTLAVTAVNDAPVPVGAAPADVVVPFGSTAVSLALGTLDYGTGGGTDEAAQTLRVRITALPSAALGQVALADGTLVSTGASYALSELRGMQLLVQPQAGGPPQNFGFEVVDDAGTANGGRDTLAGQSLQIRFLLNDAPVLAGANALPVQVEDAAADKGISVADLVRGQASDANINAASGIAIVAASSPNGDWQFSTDGGASWSTLVDVSDERARLLTTDPQNRVRFVAAHDFSGTATGLVLRAWDRTGGTALADTADARRVGADTPFSAQAVAATVQVTPINDAPGRTAGSVANVVAVEGSPGVSLGLSGVDYAVGGGADELAQSLSYLVTELPELGLGRVLLADGSSAVTAGTTYTLAQLRGMQFAVASGVTAGGGNFAFEVRDSGGRLDGGLDTLAQRLAIRVVNQAPVLIGANPLPAILEDASTNSGVLVAELVTGQVSDPGGGYGIAVTGGASAVGEWQYSRDNGTSWQGLASASNEQATLLRADAQTRIRFLPAADWNGDAGGLSLRAWDGSGGTATLTQGDTRLRGGETPYSEESASPSLRVLPVNDAPVPAAAAAATAPPEVVVTGGSRAVPLGLGDLSYSSGGGSDEAGQALTVTITAVPDPAAAVVLLADGRTPVVAGGTYTVEQLRGLVVKASGAAANQPLELSWLVRDNGGTAGGGTDQTTGKVRVSVAPPQIIDPVMPTPAVVQAAAPAPAPVAAAAPAAAPVAPAPAPAPAAKAPTEQAVGDALMTADRTANAPNPTPEPVTPAERRVIPLEAVRSSAGALLDRGSVQLVGFNPANADFVVTGFSGTGLAGARLSVDELRLALRSGGFVDELNKLRDGLRQEFDLEKTVSISVAGLSLGVSVLYVLWLIRGGVLIGSYLSALPAWRLLDPLPVLARPGEDEDEEDDALDASGSAPADPLRGIS
jgi:hypothetical protein